MATIGQQLNALPKGEFLTISKVLPSGALEARKLATGGVQFYWRFTHDKKTQREPIGIYDSTAAPKSLMPTDRGYSIAAATRVAQSLAMTHQTNLPIGGLPAVRASERAALESAKAEKAAVAQAEEDAAAFTLAKLLRDYADTLTLKQTRQSVWSMFRLHVIEAFPAVAAMPANQVPTAAFTDMVRRLKLKMHHTQANHLRTYTHAAYAMAKAAEKNPNFSAGFAKYNVTVNPVSDIAAPGPRNADKKPLSLEELRLYWKLLGQVEGWWGALLKLHVLTGGQRIKQLVRLKNEDVHADHFVLFDAKGGARGVRLSRPHPVPMTPLAAECMEICRCPGEFAFHSSRGRAAEHIQPFTVARKAQEIANGHIEGFTLKRIRSTVETILARAGVDKEVRGRLQSHGVAGVQDVHYNAHEYHEEKLEALEVLEDWLEGTPEVALEQERLARRQERAARRNPLRLVA